MRKKVISYQLSVISSPRGARGGFTLVEIIVSIAIVVGLMVATIIILNPTAQFAKGRNAQRRANLNMIIGAIGQNKFDNKGTFSCASGAIPTSTAIRMASSSYNIGPCIVPTYLPSLPYDPSTSTAKWVSVANYDTGYFIVQSATSGYIMISAPAAELGETITYTR